MVPRSSLTLRVPARGRDRERLLRFVQARFAERFGAQVPDDSPELVGAFDAAGSLVAAFGMRDASCGFFCERYVGEPLEQSLGRHFARPVERREVIEITHLCAARAGVLRQLLTAVPETLIHDGYRYLACTATACLAAYFQRCGFAAATLADAHPAALPAAERQRWGAYYQARPRVIAGDLREAACLLDLQRNREAS